MLRLHYAPRTISIAVAIALEETATPYEATAVDFASGAQTGPAYRAINPKGRVPALETSSGVLTETGAILEYAAPGLVPSDPQTAARMREVMYYLAGTMHVAHAHKMRGTRWADQQSSFADMTQKVPQTMTDCCDHLETTLRLSPFAIGDAMTCADPYLFMVVSWAPGDGVDMSAFPRLSSYMAMMSARDSIRALTVRGFL